MIGTLFFKELREMLRDRKHLLVTILLPIFVTPLMMFGVGALQASAQQERDQEVLRYTLIESITLPGLRDQLAENPRLDEVALDAIGNTQEAITQGELDFAIQISRDNDQYQVDVDYKDTAIGQSKVARIRAILDTLADNIIADRLNQIGVEQDKVDAFLTPIVLQDNNLASRQENIGQALGSFLPFLIVIWMISSAIAISSDLVAGEKERGTLETLIISPVPLLDMVVGKWLVITLAAWFAGMLTLVSLWGATAVIGLVINNSDFNELLSVFSFLTVMVAAVVMLPTAGLVSAVFFVSASFAQSFKEAQSYASGLMLLFFIPMFTTISGALELNGPTSLLPIMNTSLAFTELLKGTLAFGYVIPIVVSNALVIFAVLVGAVALYRSERVLARQ
ncbi:MAG: ABC transporter permease subunit [Reinekea sp.]|nr:ABC transporter permease subunit [Reinekea sp.]